ncbi:MAG: hypothetical protein RI560_04400 [Natronomonas sp.]|uniref:hypothetical protein n=1 Tax=Natronomonas sp. TaxID=2184060 RepID=UPI00286FD463|nr:hypothetical protein [Natronomonas sp.]MDR9380897.1 hypothetical protein [Natronomonas sp.]MDR9431873.1 hypothetical protein [Natronomonas sp.]
MPVIKQKTVRVGSRKQRIALKKLKNDLNVGGAYKYELVDLDTNTRLKDVYTNKRKAKREFSKLVRRMERDADDAESNPRGGLDLDTSNVGDPFEQDGFL